MKKIIHILMLMLAANCHAQLATGTVRRTVIMDTNGYVISHPLYFTNQFTISISPTTATQVATLTWVTNQVIVTSNAVYTAAKSYTDNMGSAATNFTAGTAGGLSNYVGSSVGAAAGAATNYTGSSVGTAAGAATNFTAGTAGGLSNYVGSSVGSAAGAATNFTAGTAGGLSNYVGSSVGSAAGAATNYINAATNEFKLTATNIINGGNIVCTREANGRDWTLAVSAVVTNTALSVLDTLTVSNNITQINGNATNAFNGTIFLNGLVLASNVTFRVPVNMGGLQATNAAAGSASDHFATVGQVNSTNTAFGVLAGVNAWSGNSNTFTKPVYMQDTLFVGVISNYSASTTNLVMQGDGNGGGFKWTNMVAGTLDNHYTTLGQMISSNAIYSNAVYGLSKSYTDGATNAIIAITNGYVGIAITNGLASQAYVGAATNALTAITNGFASQAYTGSATNALTAITNGYASQLWATSQPLIVNAITGLVQGANMTITPNGHTWTLASSGGSGTSISSNRLFLAGALSNGTVYSAIPYFLTTVEDYGGYWTYTNDSSLGTSVTLLADGCYNLNLFAYRGDTGSAIAGFSKNASSNDCSAKGIQQLSRGTNIWHNRNDSGADVVAAECSITVFLPSNTIVRPHTANAVAPNYDPTTALSITRVQ